MFERLNVVRLKRKLKRYPSGLGDDHHHFVDLPCGIAGTIHAHYRHDHTGTDWYKVEIKDPDSGELLAFTEIEESNLELITTADLTEKRERRRKE